MDVYLPIANLAVNGLVIVLLGAATGILSGIFGVGGGFLTTPMMIFYGIPPTVAAASSASQVTGASVSGVLAHSRRNGVDYEMGAVLTAGGVVGTGLGALLFNLLAAIGQIDTVINILYVVLLGTIGSLMGRESLQSLRQAKTGERPRAAKRRHHPLVANLPLRWRFYRSGLYISPIAPFVLGIIVGVLTAIMGVGGGFILVPAMVYVLRMPAGMVVGTSLLQIIVTSTLTGILQAGRNQTVDIVLASLLIVGGIVGAQYGARASYRFRAEELRAILALIVLAVGLRMGLGLFFAPDEPFVLLSGMGG